MTWALIIFYACLLIVIPLSSWLMARAALRPIKASFERQQQFVDGASHEMRTPLSVIQGELELALTRSRSAAGYQTAIATALEAANGLNRLTDDLLKLSRTTKEDLSATYASVDINATVGGAASESNAGRAVGPSVTTDLGQRSRVWGSAELISRAIGNAVDNAVKFSPPDGVVSISTSIAGEMSIIRIRDDGAGMTVEETSHAFERFWRGDGARSTPGHGLGLALVQQIMNAHDGSVTLDSARGIGTIVTLKLPLTAR